MNAWVRALSISLAAVVLTLLFVVWLFPYERVADRLSESATRWTGIGLHFEEVGPALSWGGLGLEARDARATLPSGDTFVLPSLFLRPAWSARWLLGDPQLSIAIDGDTLGRVAGVVGFANGGSWDTQLEAVRVGVLPLDQLVPGLSMEGLLTGRIEVSQDAAGSPVGELEVVFTDGNLQAPGMPVALPFERLSADIGLGGEVSATVRALAVSGPAMSATVAGSVGRGARPGAEPLDLDMRIQRVGRALEPMLAELGIELASAGPTRLKISGTLARPTFR